MNKGKSSAYALGVMVTDRNLHGVLAQVTTEGPRVLRRMIRQRNAPVPMMQPGVPAAVPELQNDPNNDFTISFGDGSSGSNDLFLASEFAGLEGAKALADAATADTTTAPISTFELELSEIIEECATAGFPSPDIGLVMGSADLVQVTIQLEKGKKRGKIDPRIAALTEVYHGDFDRDRTTFVPMLPAEDGDERSLAIAGRRSDGVQATLQLFRDQRDMRMPAFRYMDPESALLLALVRHIVGEPDPRAPRSEDTGHALILRPGPEDTLVIFLADGAILHCESMRSLTAFDSPETICSRILLQQDEFGIEELRQVFVLSEERENDLVNSLEMFFPGADILSMRTLVAEHFGLKPADLSHAEFVTASAEALRLLTKGRSGIRFTDINLLPTKFARRKVKLPVSWPQLLFMGLLFVTAFFFTARFIFNTAEITKLKRVIREAPQGVEGMDSRALQAQIDSMQATYTGYVHALDVLDSLLVGTDLWSRSLSKVARNSSVVRGFWVEKWNPREGSLELTGSAVSRDRVVQMARRLDGDIQSLAFSEIREWPVYTYVMVVPNAPELPEAAKYLRQRAIEQAAAAGKQAATPPTTTSSK